MPDVPPYPPCGGEHDYDANHEVEPVKKSLQARVFVPLLAQLLSHVCESEAPWKRTRKRVDDELLQVHPRHAGGECDERANGGQQTTDENNDFTKPIEPSIGKIQIMMRNQNVLAVF